MNSPSDKELLEGAAKAAGHSGFTFINGEGAIYLPVPGIVQPYQKWNPLTDDGDALRLAVKLGICFGPNFDGDIAVCFGYDGRNITEPLGADPYAATRRAIVQVAYAIAGEAAS